MSDGKEILGSPGAAGCVCDRLQPEQEPGRPEFRRHDNRRCGGQLSNKSGLGWSAGHRGRSGLESLAIYKGTEATTSPSGPEGYPLATTGRDWRATSPATHRLPQSGGRSAISHWTTERLPTATPLSPRSDDVCPGAPCASALLPASSGQRRARNRTSTTRGGWSITSSQLAVRFAGPCFRSCLTRGSSHPAVTAGTAQVPRAARPSAQCSRHSTGGASLEPLPDSHRLDLDVDSPCGVEGDREVFISL